MPAQPRRRFRWYDAAALIAATALGLAMTQSCLEAWDSVRDFLGEGHVVTGFRRWGFAPVPLFASLSMTLVVLRCLPPRPRLRRLARGPGIVPGLVTLLLSLEKIAEELTSLWKMNPQFFGKLDPQYVLAYPTWLVGISVNTGLVVAAVWFALWPGRWWRPEPHWIDRTGRVLGLYWIVMYAAEAYYRIAS